MTIRRLSPRAWYQYIRHVKKLLIFWEIVTDLAGAVPAIACWSMSGLPKFLPADQVKHARSL
jgi:hypothetical protein